MDMSFLNSLLSMVKIKIEIKKKSNKASRALENTYIGKEYESSENKV